MISAASVDRQPVVPKPATPSRRAPKQKPITTRTTRLSPGMCSTSFWIALRLRRDGHAVAQQRQDGIERMVRPALGDLAIVHQDRRAMADRVLFLDGGRLKGEGAPDQIEAELGL